MEIYDRLYSLYDDFDTETLRSYQEFVDLFPPIDSRIALDHWQAVNEELTDQQSEITDAFPEAGETFAAIAARATREQAFTALDLYTKYDRAVNTLVLDVDETLRSAGETDNEIPRGTLHRLSELHEMGFPIVVCTGQTLENVKGFLIQGLGSDLVHSGSLSIVYEGGTGVFTPGHGPDTKQLLYEALDEPLQAIFDRLRARVLRSAPDPIRHGCHLQGNEFNVTLKPNVETGSSRAGEIIDRALVHELEVLGEAIASGMADDVDAVQTWVRRYFADQDGEIRQVLEQQSALPRGDDAGPPAALTDWLDRIDVAYYQGDAVEVTSRELDKPTGVRAALDVLGVEDPFLIVLGDSKSDLRVMRWVAEAGCGLAAAPNHASAAVLDHVLSTDELTFAPGKAGDILRTVDALHRLATLE